MIRHLALAAFLSSLFLQSSVAADPAADVDRLFRTLGIPGGVVFIVKEGEVVFEHAHGLANVEARRPMRTDSVFWMSSLTKPVTAVTLLRMRDRKLINLDAPVSSRPLGPLFPSRIDEETTFRHILTHTSETPDRSTFMYSGSRYNFVFGAFGTTDALRDAVVREVLQPAGMRDALPGYGAPGYEARRASVVTSYRRTIEGGLARNDDAVSFDTLYPSTNLLASGRDLAAFLRALEAGDLVTPATVREMLRPPRSAAGVPLPYGLGWFVTPVGGRDLVWAYGYGDSDSSLLLWLPDRRAALIVLANSPDLSRVAQLGYGDPLRTPALGLILETFADVFDLQGLDKAGELELTRLANDHYAREETNPSALVETGLIRLAREHPAVLARPSLATLDLVARFAHPALEAITRAQIDGLLTAYPDHPLVRAAAARWFQGRGEPDASLLHQQAIVRQVSAYEQQRIRQTALDLAQRIMSRDRKAARALCWQVLLAVHRAGFTDQDAEAARRCLAKG